MSESMKVSLLRHRVWAILALFGVLFGILAITSASATPSSIYADAPDGQGRNVVGNKTLANANIQCGGSTLVTVTLTGTNGIAGNPAEIMLVLDRSGSMSGAPLAALKTAANSFVDTIDQATDGVLDGVIANGSKVGVVSFAGSDTLDQGLTSNAALVKAAITGLAAGGATAVGDGINRAQTQYTGGNSKMIIMTDGNSNAGANPNTAATNAKNAGTEIWAIGLGGGISVTSLNAWASLPLATHVFTTPTPAQLTAIFQAIGAAIIVPAASGITVVDTVDSHFSISGTGVTKGAFGTVGNVLTWTISDLGTEVVTLTYTATHDNSQSGGVEQVNDSVTYNDALNHVVTFPNPSVNVRGCAANLVLNPPLDTNELGPGQSHTVIATVTDDFNAPVSGIQVDFDVSAGPNVGANISDATNALGEASFTYAAVQGLAGLGTDDIDALASTPQPNLPNNLSDSATKNWVDTTPPDLTVPPDAVNEATGPGGATHDFVATATDDVDPAPVVVCVPPSGSLFPLGDTVITCTATDASGNQSTDTFTKTVEDTTPPLPTCDAGNNPAGNEPQAPGKGGQGQNQDGFYQISAVDIVDLDPQVFVVDMGTDDVFGTADDFTFGPFPSPTSIKYTEANGATPSIKEGSGDVDWKIKGQGDAAVIAVDFSGNVSGPVFCFVPPPPK